MHYRTFQIIPRSLNAFILLLLWYSSNLNAQDLIAYLGQNETYVITRLGEPQIRQKDHISYTNFDQTWHFYFKGHGSNVFNHIELILNASSRNDANNKWSSLSDQLVKLYNFTPVEFDVDKRICKLEKENMTAEITVKSNNGQSIYTAKAVLTLKDTDPVITGENAKLTKIGHEVEKFINYLGNSAENIFSDRGTPDSYGSHMASYYNEQTNYEFLYDGGTVNQCTMEMQIKTKAEALNIYTELNNNMNSSGYSKLKSSKVTGTEGFWTEWKKKKTIVNYHYYKTKNGWILGARVLSI